jgi:predicted ester cyclase
MKFFSTAATACLAACLAAFCPGAGAQSDTGIPAHEQQHTYTKYEQMVYDNVVQFHKNYNNHEWDKNGPLAADDLRVVSNGAIIHGRDSYIKRIARFAGPIPDVHITDLDTIVDGNKAAVRFVMTGTQKGDLQTPTGLLQATNKKFKIDGVEYFTFDKDGKLIDLLTVEDLAGMMRQLTGMD